MEFLKRKWRDRKIFEEIMSKFPNLTKTIKLTSPINTIIRNRKKATKRYVIIKGSRHTKTSDQQKILRAAREKKKKRHLFTEERR